MQCLRMIFNDSRFLIAVIAILTFTLTPLSPSQATNNDHQNISASSAVLMDLTTGKILFSKNAAEKKAPASITKILTALIALEKGHLGDLITVGANPPRVEGTRVYLVEGEVCTLEDLLYGMLLNSGNDAALAIAEYYGRSEEGFAQLMNEKAKQLGTNNSNFVNPSGLSDPNHYTTAGDLAIIARAAMQNKIFREVVATKTRPWSGKDWEANLINQNKLLWNYEGADGIKTGYTSEAHFTLVGSATRQNQTLITVLLDEASSQSAETDAMLLLDYGFREFQSYPLAKQGEVVAVINLENGKHVELLAASDLAVITNKSNGGPPTGCLRILPFKKPMQANTEVGTMVFHLNGKEVGQVKVINHQPIPPKSLSIGDWWLRISLILAVFTFLNLLIKKHRRRNRFFKNWKYSLGGGFDERY